MGGPDAIVLPPYLHENEAFDMYAAQVAHMFYVEGNRLVPWSLLDWPVAEIGHILNSNSLFSIIVDRSSIGSMPNMSPYRAGVDYQLHKSWDTYEHPCDLRKDYQFLSGARNSRGVSFIGANATETLGKINLWVAKNFKHAGTLSQNTLEHRLQPVSFASIQRIVSRRGCHSAASMIVELSRSVNIPVLATVSFFSDASTAIERVRSGRLVEGLADVPLSFLEPAHAEFSSRSF